MPVDPDLIPLKYEIESFFFEEAELIDERRFNDWLELFSDDLVYFMPIRRNVKFGEHAHAENTREGEGISWFDEDKWTLSKRVEQILTGYHYAEEPLSRTTHLISNVQLLRVEPSARDSQSIETKCRFVVHQNRVQYETNTFFGKRLDRLKRTEHGLRIERREIILDQSILLAKNLSTFF